MNEKSINLRPETLALDALIREAVNRAKTSAAHGSTDTMLFLGNRHQSFPTSVIKDPVLEPVDKLVWMVVMLQVYEAKADTAFPGYDAIGRMANISSRSTIARAISILRASRWLTLCARIRKASGQFLSNLYALHDEPLPLADALHLDAEYMAFLNKALSHSHGRVRAVAQGVLLSTDEDIEAGKEVAAMEHPIEQRIASAVDAKPGGPRRFFAFTGNVIQQLQRDLTTNQKGSDHHDQNLCMAKSQVRNSNLGSSCSSYINITTTTYTEEVSKFELGGVDGQPLVYPARLTENHREIADRHLRDLTPEQRQPILDELEGRFQAEQRGMKPVYDEASFLYSLCVLMKNGKFQPNLGIKVRDARLERENDRCHNSSATSAKQPKETDEQRQARKAIGKAGFAEVRKSLGMTVKPKIKELQ